MHGQGRRRGSLHGVLIGGRASNRSAGQIHRLSKRQFGCLCPRANDLNRAGEVVGTAGGGNESYGFGSGNGMTVPLDELLSVSDRAQWRIFFADKINEAGVIAATAIRTKDGQQNAVRLVAVGTEESERSLSAFGVCVWLRHLDCQTSHVERSRWLRRRRRACCIT
jgi:hypothetical protein